MKLGAAVAVDALPRDMTKRSLKRRDFGFSQHIRRRQLQWLWGGVAWIHVDTYCTVHIHMMFARPFIRLTSRRPAPGTLKQPRNQCLHASPPCGLPRRKDFFSSNSYAWQKHSKNEGSAEESSEPQKQRRRSARSPAAPTSLRRVAVEAQRSKDGFLTKAQLREKGLYQTKV